jgi:hypothetical protein
MPQNDALMASAKKKTPSSGVFFLEAASLWKPVCLGFFEF